MAFSVCKTINNAKNSEIDGCIDLDGVTIQEAADLIMTAASNEDTQQNPKNISNVFGNIQAWGVNVHSSNKDIANKNANYMKAMYTYLADAKYKGKEVEYRIHIFNEKNSIEKKCISDLKKLQGWKQSPESVLELLIGGSAIGIFNPEWKCFIPGAGFREKFAYGDPIETYLEANPHVKKRCRAILSILIKNGADTKVIGDILAELGGEISYAEQSIYEGEMVETISADVIEYIRRTAPGVDPCIVCGYMGTNTVKKLLSCPSFINTGTNPLIGSGMKYTGKNLVIIPPVENVKKINNLEYSFGDLDEYGIPEWVEVTAELDDILYHQVYAKGDENFKICRPRNYVDMSHMIPDGILMKYNYLVQDSETASLGLDDIETKWKLYPYDNKTNVAKVSSKQYPVEWEIHQRSERITRMELCDSDDNILGIIFPEPVPAFKRKNNIANVSFDPAGAVSVRLIEISGSGCSGDLRYEDMIHALTPMAKEELKQAVERRMIPAEGKGTHFDSLLQVFFPMNFGDWARLLVESRIWQPNTNILFDALKDYPGTMSSAMSGLGVVSNMKEMLTRSNLTPKEKDNCMAALKMYIGTMILEAVFALAKDGYAVHANNLEFLIAYPENGSGEGVTKLMKSAIKGALELVNEYLTPESQLLVGTNVELYSESEATAEWHKNNPPAGVFMGSLVAAGTPDYGYSTHDYSLRVNGHLYMFSIPYAAQYITNATLAKVYNGNAPALMRCFIGGSQDLKDGAIEAIEKSMENNSGKLYECLGFILPLNLLFNSCIFKVTGDNADRFQIKVQQIVEAKLNIAIPAYADTIIRALRAEELRFDSKVLLAPVGRGSLAINNTAVNFEQRFIERLKNEIQYMIDNRSVFPEGKTFAGNIQLLPNNDTKKVSVAQGMIDIKESGKEGKEISISPISDPTEYYLDLVYRADKDSGEADKKGYLAELEEIDTPATRAKYNAKREKLYNEAFEALINSYTYEQFEESFNRWGYTGIDEGIPDDEIGVLDDEIRNIASEQFENLIAELRQYKKELIMSCPYIEREMVCGALIDLIIERL